MISAPSREFASRPLSGDLREPASLRAALRGVDRVYHVAADYRLWSRNPKEIYESNVEGTRNLSAGGARGGSQPVRLYQHGRNHSRAGSKQPSKRKDPSALDQMIGHYKRSKFLAEREALRAAREGMAVVIVRNPTTPVGRGRLEADTHRAADRKTFCAEKHQPTWTQD